MRGLLNAVYLVVFVWRIKLAASASKDGSSHPAGGETVLVTER